MRGVRNRETPCQEDVRDTFVWLITSQLRHFTAGNITDYFSIVSGLVYQIVVPLSLSHSATSFFKYSVLMSGCCLNIY